MPRVSLVCQAMRSNPHHAVEDANLVISWTSFSKPATDLEFEMLRKFALIPVEFRIRAQSGEIVAVNDNR